MKKLLTTFCTLTFLAASVASADVILFDHDFQNGTAGNLSSGGALGTPAVGTLSATGGFVSGTRPAYTTGSNGNANNITVVANGSFNDLGTPAGNTLTATLASPADVTGTLTTGGTTTIDFNMASFGTNNQNAFKYAHIRGLSSTGDEVFQLLYRAGSNGATRELFAREDGQDNTTFSGGTLASVDGTKILDNVGNANNSTNVGAAPTGQIGVSIVIDANGWNASAAPNGGGFVSTAASGLGIASGATDLATIEFFTSQNAANGTQNNGIWVDNLVVVQTQTIPEPSSIAFLGAAGLGFLVRRRR